MNSLNEELARDRILRAEARARDASLAREIAATRRWHRISAYARAAERRHEARVAQVAAAR